MEILKIHLCWVCLFWLSIARKLFLWVFDIYLFIIYLCLPEPTWFCYAKLFFQYTTRFNLWASWPVSVPGIHMVERDCQFLLVVFWLLHAYTQINDRDIFHVFFVFFWNDKCHLFSLSLFHAGHRSENPSLLSYIVTACHDSAPPWQGR